MSLPRKIAHCPICGYPFREPRDEEELRWSFEICFCCGCEYGNDGHPGYRREWLEKGAPWHLDRPPPGWDVQEQLKNAIPDWNDDR